MKELTKAEDQIMQVLWKLEKAFVKDIIEELPKPKTGLQHGFDHHQDIGNERFCRSPHMEKRTSTFRWSRKNSTPGFTWTRCWRVFQQLIWESGVVLREGNDMDLKDIEKLLKEAKTKSHECLSELSAWKPASGLYLFLVVTSYCLEKKPTSGSTGCSVDWSCASIIFPLINIPANSPVPPSAFLVWAGCYGSRPGVFKWCYSARPLDNLGNRNRDLWGRLAFVFTRLFDSFIQNVDHVTQIITL